MVFQCDGKTYETSELQFIPAGEDGVLALYVTRDCRCVLVLGLRERGMLHVHRARAAEVRALANRYDVELLVRAAELAEAEAGAATRGSAGAAGEAGAYSPATAWAGPGGST